jgi:hypothetical protein
MTQITLRRLGSGLLAATGALHLVLAPEYLGEQAYVGVLFILGGIAALVLAARLWLTADRVAWAGGAAIAAGMAAGFVLSRTTGLPGFHESEWELSGMVSLLLELGFLAIAATHDRRRAGALMA